MRVDELELTDWHLLKLLDVAGDTGHEYSPSLYAIDLGILYLVMIHLLFEQQLHNFFYSILITMQI